MLSRRLKELEIERPDSESDNLLYDLRPIEANYYI
jgi:hypothetical protein